MGPALFDGRLPSGSLGPLKLESPASQTAGEAQTRVEQIIQTLARLFVARPDAWLAFGHLVPKVFDTHLALGSEPRRRFNEVMLGAAFEPRLKVLIAESDDLVKAPFFWNAEVMPLATADKVSSSYSTMNGATKGGAGADEVHLYSRLLALLLRLSSLRGGEVAEIARRTREVLDQFERNPEQQTFLLSVLPTIEERSRLEPHAFDEIELTVLSEVAQNGALTLGSLAAEASEASATAGPLSPRKGAQAAADEALSDEANQSSALCEKAMTTLLETYIKEKPPAEWKGLFKDAVNVGFMVKYMFRESLTLAKDKFKAVVTNRDNFKKMPNPTEVQSMLKALVDDTFASYGQVGIFDPAQLATIDFLNQPDLLVELVSASKRRESRKQKEDMLLMTEVTCQWMQHMVDQKFPPLTPHHTQAFTVMMMARFYAQHLMPLQADEGEVQKKRGGGLLGGYKAKIPLKAFIAQLATGEGKSIVIAMLAVFMVKLHGMRVHVLENNAGLLERDLRTQKPFYKRFGINAGNNLNDEEMQVCYCLKSEINKAFLRKLVAGTLDAELKRTILLVDEVDDLIVNERPNSHYVRRDDDRSPDLAKCFDVLKKDGPDAAAKPEGVDDDVWHDARRDVRSCAEKIVKDKHYRVITEGKLTRCVMLDDAGNVPKVPLTAPWLQWMNYKECGLKPISETRYACVCTPYIFNKYAGIFGLTGSVGGKAELKYLTSTYHAVKFDVPRFLDTCSGNARKVVVNHGVEVVKDADALTKRVVALAVQYYKKVPVLIIASSGAELTKLHHACQEAEKEHGAAAMPKEEVQRFSQFDEKGRSMRDKWQTIIDDATKRLGGVEDNRCRVTVTDRFGGRGHDFQVSDKESNANGGMLVVATSVPDEREWIQWKGRTARQDRPGQFYVILSEKAPPFDDSRHKKLLSRMKDKNVSDDAKIEEMLDVADDGIGARLKEFEVDQATGEKLNEVTEKYYKKFPRKWEDPWPLPANRENDQIMRRFQTDYVTRLPGEIKELAKRELNIELS